MTVSMCRTWTMQIARWSSSFHIRIYFFFIRYSFCNAHRKYNVIQAGNGMSCVVLEVICSSRLFTSDFNRLAHKIILPDMTNELQIPLNVSVWRIKPRIAVVCWDYETCSLSLSLIRPPRLAINNSEIKKTQRFTVNNSEVKKRHRDSVNTSRCVTKLNRYLVMRHQSHPLSRGVSTD